MANMFSRSELIYGKEAIELLKNKRVAIFGIGGVGGYVCESLVRTGVSHFLLVDADKVTLTNLNRQIIATQETIGQYKTEVMKVRMKSINPNCEVDIINKFFLEENDLDYDFKKIDYIVDAVDTVKAKIALVLLANKYHTPIISSMGAGNKVNPMGFVVTDINKTDVDPLAKAMRLQLRKLGIKKLKVVYSKETPLKPLDINNDEESNKREIPGSNAFVPSACGLLIASEVIRDLTNEVARDELKR